MCKAVAEALSERRRCHYRGRRDGATGKTIRRVRLVTTVQCERSEKIRTRGECGEGFEGRVRVLAAGNEHGGADELLFKGEDICDVLLCRTGRNVADASNEGRYVGDGGDFAKTRRFEKG
jgi:hypothetical protein